MRSRGRSSARGPTRIPRPSWCRSNRRSRLRRLPGSPARSLLLGRATSGSAALGSDERERQRGAEPPVAAARREVAIDLPTLAEELRRLHAAMEAETTGAREEDRAVVAVAHAEEAAAEGDGPGALRRLESAGKRAPGVAEKTGVSVAAKGGREGDAGAAAGNTGPLYAV